MEKLSPGTYVLFEAQSSKGPYYPNEVREGVVLDHRAFAEGGVVHPKVRSLARDACERENVVLVYTGTNPRHITQPRAEDVVALHQGRLTY